MIHRPVSQEGSDCTRPSRQPPAVHTHGSVGVVREGRAVLHLGRAWTVEDGDAFIVPEGILHHRQDELPCRFEGVGVCMSCLPRDRWGPPLRRLSAVVGEGGCPVLRTPPESWSELEQTLRALRTESVSPPWLVDARLGVLTALLQRAAPNCQPQRIEAPVVARALAHIARHALEPLSLVDVAAAVGRAPSDLAARVEAETGHTVGDWIANARMAQARTLLLRGDDTVDGIAGKVGPASASHVHRTPRRLHGLTPGAWRRRHRQQGIGSSGASRGRQARGRLSHT